MGVVGIGRSVSNRVRDTGQTVARVVGARSGMTERIRQGEQIVSCVESTQGFLTIGVRLTDDVSTRVILDQARMTKAVGDDFLTARKIMRIFNDLVEGIDATGQPAVRVVLVAKRLDPP